MDPPCFRLDYVFLQQLLNDVRCCCICILRSNFFSSAFTYFIRSFCNFCWRSFQTKFRIIYFFKVCSSPNGNLFVISIEDSTWCHITRLVQFRKSCDKTWHLNFQYVSSVVIQTFYNNRIAFDLNIFCI